MLNKLSGSGFDVIGVGKIGDIFAMSGLTESYPTHNNTEGMEKTSELLSRDFSGLCFVNLVDFDMLYGHRQDIDGYAKALSEFDAALPEMLGYLGEDDCLIITADHGCDPGDNSTDHTRECIPMLAYMKGEEAKNLGTVVGFDTVGNMVLDLLGIEG
jgi:phosphopentomutase